MIFCLAPLFRFLLPKKITAITLWPFIIFRTKKDIKNLVIINHEKIHLKQQVELFVIPFYIIYILEYLFLVLKYGNHNKAYRHISFEKEAYKHGNNLNYLRSRRFWAMWQQELNSN